MTDEMKKKRREPIQLRNIFIEKNLSSCLSITSPEITEDVFDNIPELENIAVKDVEKSLYESVKESKSIDLSNSIEDYIDSTNKIEIV